MRAALVETIRSVAKSNYPKSNLPLLKTLYESLTHEQDVNAQIASALCLVAVVEETNSDPEMRGWIRKVLPKLVTLVKSNAFKGKSALVELIGIATAQDRVLNESLVELVVNCLVGLLKSEDWKVRKASSEALGKIGVSQPDYLGRYKDECMLVFEARRFDKVKIVRESMNSMIEVWKHIPGVWTKETELPKADAHTNSSHEEKKNKLSVCRLPLANATQTVKVKRKSLERRSLPSLSCKNIINSGRKAEKEVSNATPVSAVPEEKNARTMGESRRLQFENKLDIKSSSRVVPCLDTECSNVTNADIVKVEINQEQKDNDLSVIRNQLLKIEKQQSGLFDLVQKLMGSSQSGINTLQTRVQSIELTLDEISRDLAVSARPLLIDEPAQKCFHLPGVEYLSPKYWRRSTGDSYTLSANPETSDMRRLAEQRGEQIYQQRARTHSNFVVNPLAEIGSNSRSGH